MTGDGAADPGPYQPTPILQHGPPALTTSSVVAVLAGIGRFAVGVAGDQHGGWIREVAGAESAE